MNEAAVPGGPRLVASGRVRRRKLVSRAMESVASLASGLAVLVLGVVVISVLLRGLPALSLDLVTTTPSTGFDSAGGGIAQALVGTLVLVGAATAMALPFGLLVAVFVSEFSDRRLARVIRLALDVLNGMPSIVIGIFVFALFVLAHGQSALAGSFALAVIMLPLVARSTAEALALVPQGLREASLALGIGRWRTIVQVVLPTTLGGILTGTTLAVGRAAGETAPLLFTSSLAADEISGDVTRPLASIPVTIFTYAEQPDPVYHQQAWAAALILIAFVLVANVLARAALARSRRRSARG